MSENTKGLIFFGIATTVFFILGQTYRQLRSFRLKRLANKYGLVYSKNFTLFYPDSRKFNTLSGSVHNKKIFIYDSVSRKSYSQGSGISTYQTIIQIGDDQIRTKPKHFTGITSIEKELKNLVR